MVVHENCVMTHYSNNIEDNIQTCKITVRKNGQIVSEEEISKPASNPAQTSMNAQESSIQWCDQSTFQK